MALVGLRQLFRRRDTTSQSQGIILAPGDRFPLVPDQHIRHTTALAGRMNALTSPLEDQIAPPHTGRVSSRTVSLTAAPEHDHIVEAGEALRTFGDRVWSAATYWPRRLWSALSKTTKSFVNSLLSPFSAARDFLDWLRARLWRNFVDILTWRIHPVANFNANPIVPVFPIIFAPDCDLAPAAVQQTCAIIPVAHMFYDFWTSMRTWGVCIGLASFHSLFASLTQITPWFLSPFTEELACHRFSVPKWLFAVHEFNSRMHQDQPSGVWAFVMHVVTDYLPLRHRIILHFGWNFFVAVICAIDDTVSNALILGFKPIDIIAFLVTVVVMVVYQVNLSDDSNTWWARFRTGNSFYQGMNTYNSPTWGVSGPIAVRYVNPIESTVPVAKLDDSARLVIDPFARVGTYVPRMIPSSIIFYHIMPSYYASNQANELRAIVNRQLMVKLTPDLPTIARYRSFLFDTRIWNSPGVSVSRIVQYPFREWVSRYPASVKVKMCEAKDRLDMGDYSQVTRRASGFVKVERSSNCTILGIEDKAPRNITSPPPDKHVIHGPWFLALAAHLKNAWHVHNDICFASGMHAEDIGHWYTYHSSRFTQYTMIKCDASRADGNQTAALMSVRHAIYRHLRIPHAEYLPRRYRSRTRHGVLGSVAGTQASGDSDTSVGNTLTFTTVMAFFLTLSGRRFGIIGMGDDVGAIVEGSDPVDLPYALLGLKAEFTTCRGLHEFEFCSGLLWPIQGTARVNCDLCSVRHVWGAKPGRLLPKIGWSVVDHSAIPKPVSRTMLRGLYLGIHKSVSFVPFVNALVDRIGHVTRGVVAKPILNEHKFLVRQRYNMCAEGLAMAGDRYHLPITFCFDRFLSLLDTVDTFPHALQWFPLVVMHTVDM